MRAVGRSMVRLPGPWSLHRRHRPTEVYKDAGDVNQCDGQPCSHVSQELCGVAKMKCKATTEAQ